jgi:hypothetical protein
MNEMKPVKKELENGETVFVYITNESSSKAVWEQKLPDIEDEHYYLNMDQWDYLQNMFNFKGISTYLMYDKTGVLRHNNTSFIGVDNR